MFSFDQEAHRGHKKYQSLAAFSIPCRIVSGLISEGAAPRPSFPFTPRDSNNEFRAFAYQISQGMPRSGTLDASRAIRASRLGILFCNYAVELHIGSNRLSNSFTAKCGNYIHDYPAHL